MGSNHDSLTSNHDSLVANLTNLLSDQQSLTSNHDSLATTLSDLLTNHDDLSANHESLSATLASLQSDHQALTDNLETLVSDHTKSKRIFLDRRPSLSWMALTLARPSTVEALGAAGQQELLVDLGCTDPSPQSWTTTRWW